MRLDPESGDVVATIGLGNEPQRIAAGEGAVWVTVRAPEDQDGHTLSHAPVRRIVTCGRSRTGGRSRRSRRNPS